MKSIRWFLLLLLCTTAYADAEKAPNIIINNYNNGDANAESQAEAKAETGAVKAAELAPPVNVWSPDNGLRLGFQLFRGTKSTVGGAGLTLDYLFKDYLGVEGRLDLSLIGKDKTGFGLFKVRLPLESPLLSLIPKAGIGYGVASLNGSSFDGPVAMLGAELQIKKTIILEAQYVGSLFSQKRVEGAPYYPPLQSNYVAEDYDLESEPLPCGTYYNNYDFGWDYPSGKSSAGFNSISLRGGVRVDKFTIGVEILNTTVGSDRSEKVGAFVNFAF